MVVLYKDTTNSGVDVGPLAETPQSQPPFSGTYLLNDTLADTSFSDFPPLLAPRPGGETCLKNSRLIDLGEVSFLLVPLMEPLEWPIHPVPQP